MDNRTVIVSLAALAQESRLAAFRLLVEAGPTGLAVGEIGASLHVAPATLSFHLKELVHAGLIVPRQEGRYIYYSANYESMDAIVGYLTENCCARDCGTSCKRPPARRRQRDASKA
jgi:DNA-binding transcriptional ArsR family regulator